SSSCLLLDGSCMSGGAWYRVGDGFVNASSEHFCDGKRDPAFDATGSGGDAGETGGTENAVVSRGERLLLRRRRWDAVARLAAAAVVAHRPRRRRVAPRTHSRVLRRRSPHAVVELAAEVDLDRAGRPV